MDIIGKTPGETPSGHESVKHVSPQFRVGHRELTREFIDTDDARYLIWERLPEGDELSRLAGWRDYEHTLGEGVCTLKVPAGTRSGASTLSGAEAWRGEKQDVLNHTLSYVKRSIRQLSVVDGNLSLYTLALTKDGKHFFTPPHQPVSDADQAESVIENLISETREILSADGSTPLFVNHFENDLRAAIQKTKRRK